MWNAFTYPSPDFNDCLNKPPLKLWLSNHTTWFYVLYDHLYREPNGGRANLFLVTKVRMVLKNVCYRVTFQAWLMIM